MLAQSVHYSSMLPRFCSDGLIRARCPGRLGESHSYRGQTTSVCRLLGQTNVAGVLQMEQEGLPEEFRRKVAKHRCLRQDYGEGGGGDGEGVGMLSRGCPGRTNCERAWNWGPAPRIGREGAGKSPPTVAYAAFLPDAVLSPCADVGGPDMTDPHRHQFLLTSEPLLLWITAAAMGCYFESFAPVPIGRKFSTSQNPTSPPC